MNLSDEIIRKFRIIINRYRTAAVSMVRQQWSAYPNDLGKAAMTSILNVMQHEVSINLIAVGQKAWILEYGKGEEMSDFDENPFLEDYLLSPNFNKLRLTESLEILGRPKGTYYDLDGNSYYSNGSMEGKPLARVFILKDRNEKYLPQPARKIIEHILIGDGTGGLISEMQDELQEAMIEIVQKAFSKFPKRIVLA